MRKPYEKRRLMLPRVFCSSKIRWAGNAESESLEFREAKNPVLAETCAIRYNTQKRKIRSVPQLMYGSGRCGGRTATDEKQPEPGRSLEERFKCRNRSVGTS